MTCWLCGFGTTKLATNASAPVCNNGCQICTAVAKVDEEINEAVAVLRHLLDKRCDLRSEQNRAHDPMHRLPVEIRSYTFELLLPRWDEWGDIVHDAGVGPSYLSTVCRSWREIARSNPYLWSTICVELGQRPVSEWIDFMHNQVLRSGGTLPLSFHIEDAVDRTEEGLNESKRDLAPVLDVMRHCSHRVRSLSLDLSPSCAFQFCTLLWHRLTQLRIFSYPPPRIDDQPHTILNPTASPEKIELVNISIQSLQISWNRLASARVHNLTLEDLTLLFRYASQMTECCISSFKYRSGDFPMPQILHHRLKTLSLPYFFDAAMAPTIMDALTFSCLQEVHTDDVLVIVNLPALVHRSSCPLTSLTLYHDIYDETYLNALKPLPSVVDLFLEAREEEYKAVVIKKLLLEGYLPNLRNLTLQLQPFLSLWKIGVIPLLLDRKRLQPEGPNEGRLPKILVVEKGEDRKLKLDRMRISDVGEELKALGVSLREDGFELL